MFSRTWAAEDAPVMTVDTFGFFAHQASENCASETSELVGDDLQVGDLLIAALVGQHALQPFVARQRRPRTFGNAVQVLAGQQARRERRPGRRAEADVLVEALVLLLHPVATQRMLYWGCSMSGLCRWWRSAMS